MTYAALFVVGFLLGRAPLKHVGAGIIFLVVLSFLLGIASAVYRESFNEYTNLRRVEGGWKVEETGAWCPWQEPVTTSAFRADSDGKWRWLPSGRQFNCHSLDARIMVNQQRQLAKKFEDK